MTTSITWPDKVESLQNIFTIHSNGENLLSHLTGSICSTDSEIMSNGMEPLADDAYQISKYCDK